MRFCTTNIDTLQIPPHTLFKTRFKYIFIDNLKWIVHQYKKTTKYKINWHFLTMSNIKLNYYFNIRLYFHNFVFTFLLLKKNSTSLGYDHSKQHEELSMVKRCFNYKLVYLFFVFYFILFIIISSIGYIQGNIGKKFPIYNLQIICF